MTDRSDPKPPSHAAEASRQGVRHRRTTDLKRGNLLGLGAFEKISAIEGVRLSAAMRADLAHMKRSGMDEQERSRFILDKYGKE